MYVPDAMKLNKLRYVKIGSPRDYFMQYGFRPMSVFSGDSVVPTSCRRIDTLNQLDALDKKAMDMENSVNVTPTVNNESTE